MKYGSPSTIEQVKDVKTIYFKYFFVVLCGRVILPVVCTTHTLICVSIVFPLYLSSVSCVHSISSQCMFVSLYNNN